MRDYFPETCGQCAHQGHCKKPCHGRYTKDLKWLAKDPLASKLIIKNGKLQRVCIFPKETSILPYDEFMAVFTKAKPTCIVGTFVNHQDRMLLEVLYGVQQ